MTGRSLNLFYSQKSYAHFFWVLLFVSATVPAQTMYRCTNPDGTQLSFRSSCPAGQVGTKMPRQSSSVTAPPDLDEMLRKATASRKEQETQLYLERANKVNNAIALRRVLVGMDADEVIRAWGRPDKVNSTSSSSGKSEQWVYNGESFRNRYVYLDNGVVRSFQTSD